MTIWVSVTIWVTVNILVIEGFCIEGIDSSIKIELFVYNSVEKMLIT